MDTHENTLNETSKYEIYATFDGFRCFVPAPGEVSDFVGLFDDEALRERARPFSFSIEDGEWAGYFACFQCGQRVALSRLRRCICGELPDVRPSQQGGVPGE